MFGSILTVSFVDELQHRPHGRMKMIDNQYHFIGIFRTGYFLGTGNRKQCHSSEDSDKVRARRAMLLVRHSFRIDICSYIRDFSPCKVDYGASFGTRRLRAARRCRNGSWPLSPLLWASFGCPTSGWPGLEATWMAIIDGDAS